MASRSAVETIVTVRSWVANTALVLGIVAVFILGFAGFGIEQHMFDLDYAVTVLATTLAPALAIGAAAAGAVGLIGAALFRPRQDFIASLLGLALAGGAFAVSERVRSNELANPPIHDVATDWKTPLMFSPSFAASGAQGANRIEADPRVQPQPQDPNLTGTRIADVNARTCPGAAPVVLTGTTKDAYAKAKAALKRDGEVIATDDPDQGQLEATATTRWLKLVSDVVVRVRKEGAGARIDIRSISREAIRDLGENCRRVSRLRAMMAK